MRVSEMPPSISHPLSFAVKEGGKLCVRDKAGRLSEKSAAGPCIKFRMIGDGQRLPMATHGDATQLNMASALRHNLKAKFSQDGSYLLAGEAFKPGQGAPPIRE